MANDMADFRLLAHPWWVNLFVLVPLVAYVLFRRRRPQLTSRELFACAVFALSFGCVEAAVAIYLGVALGFLPGHAGTLFDPARLAANLPMPQGEQFGNLSPVLLTIEVIREAATMLMLLSVAILAERSGENDLLSFSGHSLSGTLHTAFRCGAWSAGQTRPQARTCCFSSQYSGSQQMWFPVLVTILTLVVVLLTRKPEIARA